MDLADDIPRLARLVQTSREVQRCSESLFLGPGFGMPSSKRMNSQDEQYVEWRQVETFLKMAEQALKARDFATASVQQQLHDATDMLLEAKAEKSVVRIFAIPWAMMCVEARKWGPWLTCRVCVCDSRGDDCRAPSTAPRSTPARCSEFCDILYCVLLN